MKGIRLLLCVMIGLVIGSVIGIIIVNIGHSKDKKRAEVTTQEIAETTEAATQSDVVPTEEMATQSDAETTEEMTTEAGVPDEEQPATLTEYLSASLVRYEQLEEVGCKQLLVVKADGTSAQISLYTCDESGLWSDAGITTSGYVGANGVSRDSREGSRMTPAGVFPIGEAFYIDEKPDTKLSSFQITENTYWVDDPESELYNQKVELNGEKTWASAEHMIDYPSSYKYGFVVNFNMNPIEAGRGSAIFFHIGSNETLGCIATSEEMVLAYLAALDAEKQPYILIQ